MIVDDGSDVVVWKGSERYSSGIVDVFVCLFFFFFNDTATTEIYTV